jgi:hypothetical protein
MLFCFTAIGESFLPESWSIQTAPLEVFAVNNAGDGFNPLWQVILTGVLFTEAIRKTVEISKIVRRTR